MEPEDGAEDECGSEHVFSPDEVNAAVEAAMLNAAMEAAAMEFAMNIQIAAGFLWMALQEVTCVSTAGSSTDDALPGAFQGSPVQAILAAC